MILGSSDMLFCFQAQICSCNFFLNSSTVTNLLDTSRMIENIIFNTNVYLIFFTLTCKQASKILFPPPLHPLTLRDITITYFLVIFLFYIHGEFAIFRKKTISCVKSASLSVRLSFRLSGWNNSAPNGRIFIKFDI